MKVWIPAEDNHGIQSYITNGDIGGKSNQRPLEDSKKSVCERLTVMMHLKHLQLAEAQNVDVSKHFMKMGLKKIIYLLVPFRDTHDQG